MKLYSFNNEIKFCTAQFIDIFNNIPIWRRNSAGSKVTQIIVPCVNGNRSRILKSFENKNATLQIPINCLTFNNSITRDKNRVHSAHESIKFTAPPNYADARYNIGVPVNINYKLNILTKYQEDIDQICSNFVVNFNPDVYFVWPHPYNTGNIRSQIIWDGNVNYNYLGEDEPQQKPWRIEGETTFVLKTWLFPGESETVSLSGTIENINTGEYNDNLNRFFPTPTSNTFTEYRQRILNNLIDLNKNSDLIPIYGDKCWFYTTNPQYSSNSYNSSSSNSSSSHSSSSHSSSSRSSLSSSHSSSSSSSRSSSHSSSSHSSSSSSTTLACCPAFTTCNTNIWMPDVYGAYPDFDTFCQWEGSGATALWVTYMGYEYGPFNNAWGLPTFSYYDWLDDGEGGYCQMNGMGAAGSTATMYIYHYDSGYNQTCAGTIECTVPNYDSTRTQTCP